MNKNTVRQNKGADIRLQQQVTLFEGPIPSPEILQKYKEVYPESVKIIFDMAKDYQNHVINMDISGVKTARTDMILSLLLGFTGQIASFFISISGFLLAYLRPELGVAGFSFSSVAIGYLIWWKTKNTKKPE
ncbi:MAG: hypothetical protein LBT23_11940 [Synergistaceae bacterium]|jgi:uncharacterized membrane protein|nr:hypothetical protein [Synergistaceae bacterium]